MVFVRGQFALERTICSRIVTKPVFRRKVVGIHGLCLRSYSQSISPIPPPLPTDTTSKSSGLNHQLHPTGRPPLNATARTASTGPEVCDKATVERSTITGGYRTPLRVSSSNTPVNTRNSVKVIYEGPLRRTVRGLKAFSMSSLILSTTMTPFILVSEANIPMIARVSMISAGSAHW